MNYPALRLDILELFAEAQTKGDARRGWTEVLTLTRAPGGATVHLEPEVAASDWKGNQPAPLPTDYRCACGSSFATKSALGAHRWNAHGLRAVPAQPAPRPTRPRRPAPARPPAERWLSQKQKAIVGRARAHGGATPIERFELEYAKGLVARGLGMLEGRVFRLA
jgi:hypothetical protein